MTRPTLLWHAVLAFQGVSSLESLGRRSPPRSATTATSGRSSSSTARAATSRPSRRAASDDQLRRRLKKGARATSPASSPGKPDESELARADHAAGRQAAGDAQGPAAAGRRAGRADQAAGSPKGRPTTRRRWPASRSTWSHPPVYTLPPVITVAGLSRPTASCWPSRGYHEVLLHKADGSGIVARLVGLSERIESLAFSPDGKLLAVTGGSPGRFGEVQVWDVAKQEAEAVASRSPSTRSTARAGRPTAS